MQIHPCAEGGGGEGGVVSNKRARLPLMEGRYSWTNAGGVAPCCRSPQCRSPQCRLPPPLVNPVPPPCLPPGALCTHAHTHASRSAYISQLMTPSMLPFGSSTQNPWFTNCVSPPFVPSTVDPFVPSGPSFMSNT